jgi:glyoxylase-like metal-dependent hydrolase (beta-lactamase superfamily II)
MIVKLLPVGPFQANCYVLGCEETHKALVIDPGDDPERLAAEIDQNRLEVASYLHTHGHIDHVGATASLKAKLGGEILLNAADGFLYENAPEQARQFGIQIPSMEPADRTIEEGEGGICLHVAGSVMGVSPDDDGTEPDWLFTGDTLFNGSIGRTDLPGGSYEELMRSIREKLLVFRDATVVASGHGPLTTVGREKQINPFVRELL